jgi:hypothetical protein
MAATIKIKNSSTASAVPTSSDLVQGELAVNVTDKRIFTENASGTVVELGTNPSILTLPDGSASAPTLTNDGDTNTGIFFPAADTVGITTGGTERARVDSSGNLGLGVTPSAWSQGKSVETGFVGNSLWSPGGNEIIVSQGAYFNSGWKYSGSTAGAVSFYSQITGQHRWYNAPTGTAGNAISFTQAMTLDASGNLGIGTTSPASLLHIASSSVDPEIRLVRTPGSGNINTIKSDLNDLTFTSGRNLLFSAGGSERARIDSSGNLLVGTTSNSFSARSQFDGGSAGGGTFVTDSANAARAIHCWNKASTGNRMVAFYTGSGATFAGGIESSGSTTTYGTSSDYRLKENIVPMTGALQRVATLKPVTYSWKANGEEGEGFIAHELAAVCPQAVRGTKDAVDADGNPDYQTVDTSFLVATLTAAIQEQQAIINAQQTVLETLTARITALEQ